MLQKERFHFYNAITTDLDLWKKKLYDRTNGDILLDEIERIPI